MAIVGLSTLMEAVSDLPDRDLSSYIEVLKTVSSP